MKRKIRKTTWKHNLKFNSTEKIFVIGGEMIKAIKHYKRRNGCGLKEAKMAVEKYKSKL